MIICYHVVASAMEESVAAVGAEVVVAVVAAVAVAIAVLDCCLL